MAQEEIKITKMVNTNKNLRERNGLLALENEKLRKEIAFLNSQLKEAQDKNAAYNAGIRDVLKDNDCYMNGRSIDKICELI